MYMYVCIYIYVCACVSECLCVCACVYTHTFTTYIRYIPPQGDSPAAPISDAIGLTRCLLKVLCIY